MYICKKCKDMIYTTTNLLGGMVFFREDADGELKPILRCPICRDDDLQKITFWDALWVYFGWKNVKDLVK